MRVSLAMIVLVAFTSRVSADTEETTSRFSGSVGIGIATLRDYEGGGKTRGLGAPLLNIKASTRFGAFALNQQGLSWTPIDTGILRTGLLATYDIGRTDDRPSDANYRPGSTYLRGMGNIDGTPELGGFIGWTFAKLAADLSVRHAVGSQGHDGTLADISLSMPVYSGTALQLVAKPSATWADAQYTQTYFGVTVAQATSSRFPIYSAGSGIKSVQLDLTASYALTARWSAIAMMSYVSLVGDAADSPIVQNSGYPQFALFVARTFGQ